MKDYVIITDSGCDLPAKMIEEKNIKVVPMGLAIAGNVYKHYHDYRELSAEDFYALIRSGNIGTTSCVNIDDVSSEMRKWAADYDILYLSFSSGMSGSYQSAVIASKEIKEEYPESNIIVIDTLSGSIGLGMLAYLAAEYKAKNHSISETAQYIEDNKLNICHYFMVDDLKYIQKTGRVSTMSAIVGTALGIKPIFRLDDGGKVDLVDKIRGKKACIKTLYSFANEKNTDANIFFICHADSTNSAEQVAEGIKEKYPNTQIIINAVGPILGNNTGPGAVAVIFYGNNRHSAHE